MANSRECPAGYVFINPWYVTLEKHLHPITTNTITYERQLRSRHALPVSHWETSYLKRIACVVCRSEFVRPTHVPETACPACGHRASDPVPRPEAV